MKKYLGGLMILAASTPVFAGDIHGRVTCTGATCADTVVYVGAIAGKTFPAPAAHAKVNQLNMTFAPRVLPVIVGATVDFLNSDAVLHNVFSPDACAEKFNLGTWPRGGVKSWTFKKECAATLLCKVHPDMEAYVVAVPTPYFAQPGPDGSYRIADVPDGAVTVKLWQPRKKAREKAVSVAGATEVDFDLSR